MTATDYRIKAEECERKAREGDPTLRAMYLAFENEYRHFAERLDLVEAQAKKRFVVKHGCPELLEALNRAQLDIDTAVDLARLPHADQIKCSLDEKLCHFFTRIMHSEESKALRDLT